MRASGVAYAGYNNLSVGCQGWQPNDLVSATNYGLD